MELTPEFRESVEDAMVTLEQLVMTEEDVALGRVDRAIYKVGLVIGQLEAMRAQQTGTFDTGEQN